MASPRRGAKVFVMSMDTSVPRQRDTSDAALVDMLMVEASVGLALFGARLAFPLGECCPDQARRAGWGECLRTAGLDRLAAVRGLARARRDPGGDRAAQGPGRGRTADPARLSRGQPRPPQSASPADGAATAGDPAGDPAGGALAAGPEDADVSGCASWFPVRDAAGEGLRASAWSC